MSCHKRMLLLHEPGSRYTLAKADRWSYRKPKHLVARAKPVDCFRVISDFCRLVCYASVELPSGESGIGRRNPYASEIERAASQGAQACGIHKRDRLVFAGLYRLVLDAVKTLKLESTSAGGVKRPISLPAMRRSGRASARR